MVAKGATQYFLSDLLSVRLTMDGIGNAIGRQAHLPFGEDFGESGTQEKHHFAGYERDSEIATDYAENRQYGQTVGRFLQIDPAACNNDTPQTLNRYSYAHNDSVNFSDPDGKMAEKVGGGSAIEVGFGEDRLDNEG